MAQPSYTGSNGYIGETFFTIVMGAALDAANPPLLGAFNVQINGTGVGVSSVVVDSAARTVTVGIGGYSLTPGDIIDFVYTDPTGGDDVSAIQGTDGADSASFTNSLIVYTTRPVTSPTITDVTSSTADGFVKIGDTVSIQVAFSEAVNVTGTPQLLLETGATDRAAVYTAGAGTNTLTFTYTVQPGDTSADLDYISSAALSLNGGTIRNAGGGDATLTLAAPGAAGSLGANRAIVVDGVAPVITGVSIPQANFSPSTHPDDIHAYHVGDTVTATISVSADPGTYTLEASTVAGFALSSLTRVNSTTYTATFTVTAGATAYAAADALPVNVTLRDAAGNLSNTYTTAIVQANDRIDTNAPPVPGVQTVTPALVDTAIDDSFPILQGTLVATDPENQTLTYGIPSNATAGNYVVNGVNYDVVSADIFGNAQYVDTQTGNYAYVFASAYLNGIPAATINTTAHFSVSDGNRTVVVDVPLSFQGANDAPVLSADGRILHAVDQGIGDGANVGTTVTNILASAGTATDAEYNPAFVLSGNTTVQGVTILPLGVAITAVNNQNGTWQYKVGAGAWTDISSVSASNALLLTGADSVRFVPATGAYAGTDTGGITFKAWDRTSGTAGTQVDTTTGSAFSTALATASITVDALPTLSATGSSATYGVGVSNPIDLFSNVSTSTIEQGQYFVGARISVSGVLDASEVLTIGGTDVVLANGTVSLPGLGTAGGAGSVTVTLVNGTATLVFSGLQQSDAAMGALLDAMTYKNTTTGATPGNRVVSIASLTDNGGSSGQAVTSGASATVTVADVTAPAAPSTPQMTTGTDTGPSNADAITSNTTPTFTGTAEPNSVVTLYEGTTVLGSATANGSGIWSITSTTLSAGPHSLTAKAADSSSNVSLASSALNVVIDTSAPGAVALNTNLVALVNAANGATVATLQATDTTAVSYVLATGSAGNDADNGKFSISGNSLVATQNLSVGTYHVYVQATDAAGNTSLQALTFSVVDAPGVTSIVRAGSASPTVPSSATSVSYTVTFDQSVTGVDASDFELVTSGNATGTIGVTGSGTTYTVTISDISGDGSLRLDLKNTGTGIQNGSSVAVVGGYTSGETFTVDHTAPLAPGAFTMNPLDDTGTSSTDAITSVNTPRFSGVAEANATVRLYDTDGTTVLGTTTADGAGNWTITSSTLGYGAHTLLVRQTDAAGNVSPGSATLAVDIDRSASAPAAPTLAVSSDTGTPGDGRTSIVTPTITGTAEAFATVTLYATDGVTTLGTTTANASGAWSIVPTTLGEGTHSLTVRQVDRAGNASGASAALNLTVDTTAPLAGATPVLATASDSGTQGDGITNVAAPVITGTAEPNAVITLYDTNGTTVLGTATANGSGSWSITSSSLSIGTHTLTYTQKDAAGNISAPSAGLTLSIIAPPAPPTTTIDGVQVGETTVNLPGGGTGTQIIVPIVTTGRNDTTGSSGVADIPLSTAGASTLLLAQVGVGYGLTSSGGASEPAGSSLERLIQSIIAATPDHPASDQGYLTGNGQTFLSLLPTTVPLLVQTIVPVTGSTAPTSTLTLIGTSTETQHTALVIDVEGVAPGTTLTLRDVDFAAIIGAATVTGDTADQILAGDAADQQFVVDAALGSSVFAGAGADTLRITQASGSDASGRAVQAAPPAASDTILHGGLGDDAAVFAGAQADYDIATSDAHIVVTSKAGDVAYLVNAETLRFADGSISVQHAQSLSTIAALYADVLDRQGDVAGLEFWVASARQGASLGQVALGLIDSAEGRTQQETFNGVAAHDVEILYQAIFSRHSEAAGLAYWVDRMAEGMSLAEVAEQFVRSDEAGTHALSAVQWDFIV